METGENKMKFIKDVYKNRILLLMTLPVVIMIVLFKYCPMFGVVMAFQNFKFSTGIFGSDWVGFKNFEFLFKTADAWLITRNTLLYNITFIALGMMCAVALAIIYDMLGKSRLNRINQILVLFPHFISWVVGSYFVFALLSYDKGLLNSVISFFGGERINWYNEPKFWPFILPIAYLWKQVGYSSIIYYSNIKGISLEYYEAAKIDGAGWMQQVRFITLPLLKPILIVMFILNMGTIFGSDFGLFYLVTRNSGSLYAVTSTIDTYVYNGLMSGGNLGMSAATGLYQSVVAFIFVMTSNAIIRKVSPEDAMF